MSLGRVEENKLEKLYEAISKHLEFGELKGTLKVRPIFHWNDKRIIGHRVLCFLAYLCEAHLTKLLRERTERLEKKSVGKGYIRSRGLNVFQANAQKLSNSGIISSKFLRSLGLINI
jgi:transposase